MGGCGVGDGVQDEAHGAHDVELHDGAPGEAFFAEGARGVHELEVYPITSNCDVFSSGLWHVKGVTHF